MKRSFLTALGIEKDIIDQIMSEHGATVELIKEKAGETAEVQIEKLNLKIADLQEKIDEAPDGDGAAWKKKYDDEGIAHQATKDEYAAEKDGEETATLLRTALEADGANPKAIDLLLNAIDVKSIKKKDGKLGNWEDISKPLKEKYADFFGEAKWTGADVGNPPAGGGGGVKNPWLKEHRNLAAQTKIFREDPALARSLAAAAGVKI